MKIEQQVVVCLVSGIGGILVGCKVSHFKEKGGEITALAVAAILSFIQVSLQTNTSLYKHSFIFFSCLGMFCTWHLIQRVNRAGQKGHIMTAVAAAATTFSLWHLTMRVI